MEVFHGTAIYGVTLAIWDHTVLPATRHKWTHPALTPAMQAGTRFTYPGGMKGWVDLVDLIAPRPGVEPATFRSRVQRSTNATTKTTLALAKPDWLNIANYRPTWSVHVDLGELPVQMRHVPYV